MKILKISLSMLAILSVGIPSLYAKGAGTSGGLTLLEPYGARPAALGEAFSAMANDITAFGYNPSSLRSLEYGQASFMYEKGMVEDSYGQFLMGMPTRGGKGWGLAVGYYNGGEFELVEEPTPGNFTTRNVTAQRDLTVSLGYATEVWGMDIGIAGKYISSKLIDQYSASAFAGDVGLQMPLGGRIRVGGGVQNFGTELKYIEEGDSLPRIVRGGMSFLMIPGRYQTTLLAEAPYYVNEGETKPSLGLETMIGPMALRAGYKSGGDLNEFTFGAGFMLGRGSLDYSFGMVEELDPEHRVSMKMGFGGERADVHEIVRRRPVEVERVVRSREEERPSRTAVEFGERKHTLGGKTAAAAGSQNRRVYTVKAGDTLAKIARRYYGDAKEWKKIYTFNRHLLDDSRALEIGQKIVLP